MSVNFKIGGQVTTDFSGTVTLHRIIEMSFGQVSQTGVLLKVYPYVPKSSDKDAWIDSAWFKLEGAA